MNLNALPNAITITRLVLLVPLSFYLSSNEYTVALVLFFIAGVSDALDGFLAKRFGWESRLGSILDPLADKALLVITMAILTLNNKISLTLFFAVMLRDIYIVIGAMVYRRKSGPYDMKPSWLSKLNTFVQLLMVTLLLYSLGYKALPSAVFDYLSYFVYVTIVLSSVHYTVVWGKKYRQLPTPPSK